MRFEALKRANVKRATKAKATVSCPIMLFIDKNGNLNFIQ